MLNPPFANCPMKELLKSEDTWGFILKTHPKEGKFRFEVLACRKNGLPERGFLSSFWPQAMQISKNFPSKTQI